MKIGFTSLLTLILITLKLTHYIDWSWWLVLAPSWASWLVAFVVLVAIESHEQREKAKTARRRRW